MERFKSMSTNDNRSDLFSKSVQSNVKEFGFTNAKEDIENKMKKTKERLNLSSKIHEKSLRDEESINNASKNLGKEMQWLVALSFLANSTIKSVSGGIKEYQEQKLNQENIDYEGILKGIEGGKQFTEDYDKFRKTFADIKATEALIEINASQNIDPTIKDIIDKEGAATLNELNSELTKTVKDMKIYNGLDEIKTFEDVDEFVKFLDDNKIENPKNGEDKYRQDLQAVKIGELTEYFEIQKLIQKEDIDIKEILDNTRKDIMGVDANGEIIQTEFELQNEKEETIELIEKEVSIDLIKEEIIDTLPSIVSKG